MSPKKILILVAAAILLVGGGYLMGKNFSSPSPDVVIQEKEFKALAFDKLSDAAGKKGVTGYTYIEKNVISQNSGWFSWQGTDVVWVPFWREDDPKVAYKIPGADLATFVVFDTGTDKLVWAKDAHQVYYRYQILDADPATFTVFSAGHGIYGADKNFTYIPGENGAFTQIPR